MNNEKIRIVNDKKEFKIKKQNLYKDVINIETFFVQDKNEKLIGMITINWNNNGKNTYNLVLRDGDFKSGVSISDILKYCENNKYEVFYQ